MVPSVWSLMLTAALPVVNVFLMTAVGAALARKGVLDARARSTLSQLVFYVFVPSLTFFNLAGSVNLSDLAVWWILPANMCLSIGIGLGVGWLTGRLLRVDAWFRNHFMCVCALGNVGNLPLVLSATICANPATPFAASLGAQCERLGIAYIAFGMWVASTFQYCVAYNLMKAPEAKGQLQQQLQQQPQLTAAAGSAPQDSKQQQQQQQQQQQRQQRRSSPAGKGGIELVVRGEAGESPFWREPAAAHAFGSSTAAAEQEQGSGQEGWQDASQEEGRALLLPSDSPSAAAAAAVPGSEQRHGRATERLQRWLKRVPWASYLNLPTLAAFAGLTVGCVSFLKGLLFGEAPPLGFLTQSLEVMAGGMIPTMMLILGGSLGKGPGKTDLPLRVIAGSLLVRLAVVPAIGTGAVVAMQRARLFTPPDSLFTFTLLLMHACPTAMNLQTVATLVQNGQDQIAALLCWQYLACLVSLPLWMCLFVWLVA